MMTSILWKICTLLSLVLINTDVECRNCYIDDLDKIDGICTGQITCYRDLDFDVRTWSCIRQYGYATPGSDYSPYRSKYNAFGYRPYYRSRPTITYDDNYNLVVYLKEPRERYSLLQYRVHTIQLILEDGDYLTMPEEVLLMRNLTEFTIFGSNIAHVNLSKFDSIDTLEKLNITNNKIRVIETDNNEIINNGSKVSYIQIIDISHNHIEVLPNNFVSRFSQLLHLNLSHNMISSIDSPAFEGITQLQTLDISHNRLIEIGHPLGWVNLKELYISYNKITKLFAYNFEALTNLEKLNVSNNDISSIEKNAFQALINLQEVDFRFNNLTRICNETFSNNVNLSSLFLSSNKIQTIEENSFKRRKLQRFCTRQ